MCVSLLSVPVSVATLCVVRYESGDHVAVFPTNDAALVNKLGQVLGVDLDIVISLNNLDGNMLNPLKGTLIFCVVARLRLRDYAIACPVAKLHHYHCNPVFITQGPQSHASVASLASSVRFPCMYVKQSGVVSTDC